MDIEARFWAKVDRRGDGECWPWLGAQSREYGQFWCGGCLTAHRIAWELTHGAIPNGLLVLHRCDNPPCCNPAHLWLGTHADNAADRQAKGRGAVGDANGARSRPERRARGERNGKAKLTAGDVRAIRTLAGALSLGALATRFAVSPRTVDGVIRRRLWRHVS